MLTPVNSKYANLPAKGARVVVTYVPLRNEHIASYQRVLLTKNAFSVPALTYPVRKRLTKKGPDPMERTQI